MNILKELLYVFLVSIVFCYDSVCFTVPPHPCSKAHRDHFKNATLHVLKNSQKVNVNRNSIRTRLGCGSDVAVSTKYLPENKRRHFLPSKLAPCLQPSTETRSAPSRDSGQCGR